MTLQFLEGLLSGVAIAGFALVFFAIALVWLRR